MRYVIGLDVGGTTMKAAAMDETGRILARGAKETGPLGRPELLFERILALIEELRGGAGVPIEAVGIAIPGPFDPKRGLSVHSPNLGWKQVDVRTPLSAGCDLPLYFEHDLRTATLGEATFGAGRGVDNMIFAPLGTGFGAGVYSQGRLLAGTSGFFGEIGHVTVVGNDARCNCGKIGCVETIASAPGIARLAREELERLLQQDAELAQKSPLYLLAGGDLAAITASVVAQAVDAGDQAARSAWHAACEVIGWALAILINLFGPQKVIVGGGVSKAGELLLEPVRRSVERHAMATLYDCVEISIAELGADAGILGAGALALQSHSDGEKRGAILR
ncbi:UNVERIFIED_CONTAM: glucokinase [Brevibacillus sp. OAP136]